MKTKIFYRVDYWPANNKGAGYLIGFFDDLSDAMNEIPHNYSQTDQTMTEAEQKLNAHHTLATYSGPGNLTAEQAWEQGHILTDDTFILNQQ
jgi:hypothetical protein